MTIENLLEECGGLGKFQILAFIGISLHKLTSGWSMLLMSFAGYIPDWYCVIGLDTANESIYTNQTLKMCSLNNSITEYHDEDCRSYHFEESARTVISEWDVICDQKWIKATITSVQMVGVLFGAILAGQLADLIGRKKTLFGISLYHSLLNLGAAFSTSWEIFMAFRFFLGIGIGGLLVATYPYQLEFITLKWRPLIGILPVWACGVSLFSLAAFILQDWAHLHIACGVIGLPAMLTYFFLPESARWLTIRGRYQEAVQVFAKIAQTNGTTLPTQTQAVLEKVYLEEQESRSNGRRYSYCDLFTTWKQAKVTLILGYNWLMLSMVYYGISFGVSALAGNLYLNIFLLTVVELPAQMTTSYFNNKIGRRWTATGLLSIAALSFCGCLVVQFTLSTDAKKEWITGFSLTAKMGIGAGWAAIQVWSTESYPTVVRSLGFGIINSAARIGGILAPFIIDLDNNQVSAYIIITSMVVLAILLSSFLPETKGQLLAESFTITLSPRTDNDTKMAVISTNDFDNGKTNKGFVEIASTDYSAFKMKDSPVCIEDSPVHVDDSPAYVVRL